MQVFSWSCLPFMTRTASIFHWTTFKVTLSPPPPKNLPNCNTLFRPVHEQTRACMGVLLALRCGAFGQPIHFNCLPNGWQWHQRSCMHLFFKCTPPKRMLPCFFWCTTTHVNKKHWGAIKNEWHRSVPISRTHRYQAGPKRRVYPFTFPDTLAVDHLKNDPPKLCKKTITSRSVDLLSLRRLSLVSP